MAWLWKLAWRPSNERSHCRSIQPIGVLPISNLLNTLSRITKVRRGENRSGCAANSVLLKIRANKFVYRYSIIGLGKLGASIAAAIASRGHRVIGVDQDEKVVKLINAGRAPVHETGLDKLIAAHR